MSISNGFPGVVKLATQKESGLMSSSDKIKLDNINPSDITNAKEDITKLKDTVIPTQIYGIKIDLNNADPYSSVTYTDGATGFVPLYVNQITSECNYGSWEDIIKSIIRPKPVLIKNGSIISYLDSENYARTVYGSGIDISNEDSGDVFIEFAKLPYKIEINGSILTFKIATKHIDDTWSYDAFLSENGIPKVKDYMYYGAYEGFVDGDGKLRSLSNKYPSHSKPIFQFRSYATNNGLGYQMINYAKRIYVSLLAIMVTKTTNIINAIGKGVSELEFNGENRSIKTGTMDTKGLFYGNNNGIDGMKLFGIENFCGDLSEFCEGLIKIKGSLYYKNSAPYNDNGGSYSLLGSYPDGSGWVKKVTQYNNSIIVPSEFTGDSSKYFCSYSYGAKDNNLSYVLSIGGSFYTNQSNGLLCLDFRNEVETLNIATGSRLGYCN